MNTIWTWLGLVAVICGLIAVEVARECGRPIVQSFLYGAFLGPFGILLVALLPRHSDHVQTGPVPKR